MPVERATALPIGAEWIYELGWSGDRVLAVKQDTGVRLMGALRRDVTNRFPVLAAALAKLAVSAIVLDGLVAALTRTQRAAFESSGESLASDAFGLIVTDVLSLEASDVRQWPYRSRRERLQELVRGTGLLLAPLLPSAPRRMLEIARQSEADAIVARRWESRYRPFTRTGDWLRISLADAERWLREQSAAIEAGPGAGWTGGAGGLDPLWTRG